MKTTKRPYFEPAHAHKGSITDEDGELMHEGRRDGVQPYIPYNTTELASAIRRGTGDKQNWISNPSANRTLIDLRVEQISDPTVADSGQCLPLVATAC